MPVIPEGEWLKAKELQALGSTPLSCWVAACGQLGEVVRIHGLDSCLNVQDARSTFVVGISINDL